LGPWRTSLTARISCSVISGLDRGIICMSPFPGPDKGQIGLLCSSAIKTVFATKNREDEEIQPVLESLWDPSGSLQHIERKGVRVD
jgi:hypothetical protein